MAESDWNKYTFPLAMILGVAAIGFVYGTSPADYHFANPITTWETPDHPGVPTARSYTEEGMDTDQGDVATACTDCHKDRISLVGHGERVEHPIGVQLPRMADLAALNAAGSRTDVDADGNRVLLCRSCHRPHNAFTKPRLVLPADDGTLCLKCHGDHAPGRSQHPVSGTIDPTILATIRSLKGETSHGLTCLSCHSPHKAASGTLLRTPNDGTQACQTCHADKAAAMAGVGHGGRFCEDCHGMHTPPSHLGRGPVSPDPADQYCLDCHDDGGKIKQINPKGGHPMWVPFTAAMIETGHVGTVGCTDCHTPHASGNKLLIKKTVIDTCLSCHPEKATLPGTKHDAAVVNVNGETRTCLSCHAIHGNGSRPAPPTGVNPASAFCLSCHDGRTTARKVGPYRHPTGVLLTTSGLPARYSGPIPYFGPDGKRTTNRETGEITCQTCHDPHTWKHDANEHPGNVEGSEQNSFLRDPDTIAAFCTVCHGEDGRPRFRFFHAQEYRKNDPPQQ